MSFQKSIDNKGRRFKRHIDKRGSALVEASLTLPLFIVATLALALIINVISICENIGFVTARDTKELSLEAGTSGIRFVLFRYDLKQDVLSENDALRDFSIRDFDYLVSDETAGIDDLITVKTRANFTVNNLGILGFTAFDQNLAARAFTGDERPFSPLPVNEFQDNGKSEIVIIFPRYGIRYHNENCSILKQEDAYTVEIELRDAEMKGYTPCKLCGG